MNFDRLPKGRVRSERMFRNVMTTDLKMGVGFLGSYVGVLFVLVNL